MAISIPFLTKKKPPPSIYDIVISADNMWTPPKKKKPMSMKTKLILGGTVVACLMAGAFGMMWFAPLKGSMQTALCKTFMELRVVYPSSLEIVAAEEVFPSTRVYYTYTGAFGERRSGMVECTFVQDQTTGIINLDAIAINRKPIDREIVMDYKDTLIAAMAGNLDLTVPYYTGDGLEGLRWQNLGLGIRRRDGF